MKKIAVIVAMLLSGAVAMVATADAAPAIETNTAITGSTHTWGCAGNGYVNLAVCVTNPLPPR